MVLFVATVPLFFQHSTIGMANLPLATYLVLGVLWSFDGFSRNKISWLLMGGIFLALAAWTRPEGIGYCLVLLAGIFCVAVRGLKVNLRLAHWSAALLPILIIPTSWLVLLGIREMRQDQVGNALDSFLHGAYSVNFIWNSFRQIAAFGVKYFSDFHGAGFLVPVNLIIFGTTLFFIPLKDRYLPVWLFLFSCLAAAFPVGMFIIASFSEQDFGVFLSQSFDRAFLPAIVLFAISAFLVFGVGKNIPEIGPEKRT